MGVGCRVTWGIFLIEDTSVYVHADGNYPDKENDNGREMMINEAVFKRQEVMGSRTHVEDLTLIRRGSLPQL